MVTSLRPDAAKFACMSTGSGKVCLSHVKYLSKSHHAKLRRSQLGCLSHDPDNTPEDFTSAAL